jgi:hypothetical protein
MSAEQSETRKRVSSLLDAAVRSGMSSEVRWNSYSGLVNPLFIIKHRVLDLRTGIDVRRSSLDSRYPLINLSPSAVQGSLALSQIERRMSDLSSSSATAPIFQAHNKTHT